MKNDICTIEGVKSSPCLSSDLTQQFQHSNLNTNSQELGLTSKTIASKPALKQEIGKSDIILKNTF